MKHPEYVEGHEALKNFERLAITVLQATKVGGGREIVEKSSKKAGKRKAETLCKG